MKNRIEELTKKYSLKNHPEGGFYKETFRSEQNVSMNNQDYSSCTLIYYLLRNFKHSDDFSAWHKLHGLEETWLYHEGCNLTIYMIDKHGEIETHYLGSGDNADYQVIIPKDTWFAAVVDGIEETDFSFVSCAVSPGFDFKCFELAKRETMLSIYPHHKDIINRLTRC